MYEVWSPDQVVNNPRMQLKQLPCTDWKVMPVFRREGSQRTWLKKRPWSLDLNKCPGRVGVEEVFGSLLCFDFNKSSVRSGGTLEEISVFHQPSANLGRASFL